MDENTIRLIEKEGAEALLDTGLSVPLKELHLPFAKIHPFTCDHAPTYLGRANQNCKGMAGNGRDQRRNVAFLQGGRNEIPC